MSWRPHLWFLWQIGVFPAMRAMGCGCSIPTREVGHNRSLPVTSYWMLNKSPSSFGGPTTTVGTISIVLGWREVMLVPGTSQDKDIMF